MLDSEKNSGKREDSEVISISDTSSNNEEDGKNERESRSVEAKSALEFAESVIMDEEILDDFSSDTDESIDAPNFNNKGQTESKKDSKVKHVESKPSLRELCASAAEKRQIVAKEEDESAKVGNANTEREQATMKVKLEDSSRLHSLKRSGGSNGNKTKRPHIERTGVNSNSKEPYELRSPIHLISNPEYCDVYCKNGNKDTVSMTDMMGSKTLVKTYQFNFLIDATFLLQYIKADPRNLELILIGHKDEQHMSVNSEDHHRYRIKMVDATKRLGHYGSHHTKMMVNMFRDGTCQIIVHTMNLTVTDYTLQTQMCWMSPKLHKCSSKDQAERYKGEGLDSIKDVGDIFKNDFLAYLSTYELPETDALIKELQPYDFTCIDVQFVASSPGKYELITERLDYPMEYYGSEAEMFGFGKLYDYLKIYGLTSLWGRFIGQTSSIASPFDRKKSNIFTHLLISIAMGYGRLVLEPSTSFDIKDRGMYPMIIWPTLKEVLQASGSILSGYALHYRNTRWRNYRGNEYQDKQLRKYFFKWSSVAASQQSKAGRSHLMPHCKTYCVTEDNLYTIKWFLMTSANMSTQAWGRPEVSANYFKAYKYTLGERLKFNIASYEAGILVNPKTLKTRSIDAEKEVVLVPTLGQDTVPKERVEQSPNDKQLLYPVRIPYDIPLQKYTDEQPWTTGVLEGNNR